MQALTHWILGSVRQATLITAACYILPFFDFIAIIIQTFVTLRQGMRRGLIVILASIFLGVTGRVLLAALFTDVSLTLLKESIIWAMILSLPLWGFAGLLRKTVSLEFTTQAMTLIFVGLFAVIHYFDINILPLALKQALGESVNNLVNSLIAIQDHTQPNQITVLPEHVEQLSKFLVHLFEIVTLYMVNLSLLIFARIWQSQVFMPKVFIKEFINVRSGKLISGLFLGFSIAVLLSASNFYFYLLVGTIFGIWFIFTGIVFVHWAIHTYNLSWGFTAFFYISMFIPVLSGIVLLILIMLGLVDGFINLRSVALRMKQVS